MLVVIPTFRRNECLRWVLESLAHCTTTGVAEPVRVLVVANHPPAANEVEAIARPFFGRGGFEWRLLKRERTLDPVDNWYSAIREHARDGEIVLLHGDDDLFFPWSLEARWKMLQEAGADFLLTPFVSRVFFDKGGETAYFSGKLPSAPKTLAWQPWDYAAENAPEPSFIGAHAYRYGARLEAALRATLEACHTQTWVNRRNQELMLPFYLPFFLKRQDGGIIMSDLPCVLRGATISEICSSPFGVPSWNTCFVSLLALSMIKSGRLGCDSRLFLYSELRFKCALRDIPTMLVDKRVPFGVALKTMRAADVKFRYVLRPICWRAWIIVLLNAFGLVGFRLKKKAEKRSIPAQGFVHTIAALSPISVREGL